MGSPAADAAAKQQYDRMRDEIAALAGVVDVGIGSPVPLRSSIALIEVKAEGKALAVGEAMPYAELRTANPEFFNAVGIPLLEGRAFSATDRVGSGRVVIINQSLADRYFPNEDPLGKRIAWTGDVLRFSPITDDWRTIVGVVGNTQDGGLDAPTRHVVYMPFTQFPAIDGGLVIRADGDVATLTQAPTRAVRRIAPPLPSTTCGPSHGSKMRASRRGG